MAHDDKQKRSFSQRWGKVRPTKTIVFWSVIGAIVLTMLVGFNWGGWVTGSTANRAAKVMAEGAVIQRLTPICVAQFNQDPEKDQKLQELKAANSYQRTSYVKNQGWATMPDEEKPNNKVASECTQQLMLIDQ
jgi:hypothetical protein